MPDALANQQSLDHAPGHAKHLFAFELDLKSNRLDGIDKVVVEIGLLHPHALELVLDGRIVRVLLIEEDVAGIAELAPHTLVVLLGGEADALPGVL